MKILSTLHSLTSFLLGLSAGILSLQSSTGFVFYLAGTVLVSGLFHLLLIYRSSGDTSSSRAARASGAGAFFVGNGGEIEGVDSKGFISIGSGSASASGPGARGHVLRKGAWRDVWFGGGVLSEALSGFVLGWAGVGGVLR